MSTFANRPLPFSPASLTSTISDIIAFSCCALLSWDSSSLPGRVKHKLAWRLFRMVLFHIHTDSGGCYPWGGRCFGVDCNLPQQTCWFLKVPMYHPLSDRFDYNSTKKVHPMADVSWLLFQWLHCLDACGCEATTILILVHLLTSGCSSTGPDSLWCNPSDYRKWY